MIAKSKHSIKAVLQSLSFVGLLLASNRVSSQELKTTRDIGVWAEIGLKYRINKKWSTSISQGIRTFDNALTVKKTVSDLGVSYKINKEFSLDAGGRYGYARKKDNAFTHDIRYNLDFNFKKKFAENWAFSYRLRFQHNYINLFTFVPDVRQRSHIRNRVKVQYELSKHKIYFASEIFREFVYYKRPEFNSLRLSLGDQVKTDLGNFDYAFVYERELNDAYPLNFFFLNLNYTFKLKHD